jgi:hypothetical protein
MTDYEASSLTRTRRQSPTDPLPNEVRTRLLEGHLRPLHREPASGTDWSHALSRFLRGLRPRPSVRTVMTAFFSWAR